MSIIAVFPKYLIVKLPDNEYDYTSGEKYIGRFLNRNLYQTTLVIPITDLPSTGLTTYNKYNHGIQDIDVPLYIRDYSLLSGGTANAYSKGVLKMQANSANTSQYHFYMERFTKTQLWIIRGTKAANEADTLYVTVQYFKVGE